MSNKDISIYVKCNNSFGNQIFDLISAVYLKKKYNVTVFVALPLKLFLSKIFDKTLTLLKFINVKEYTAIKETVTEIYVDSLETLPQSLQNNTRFTNLYPFTYTMYNSLDNQTKKCFELNKNLINPILLEKYIGQNYNYACVHIRYGNKLCDSLITQSAQLTQAVPIYTPQYYIDQINTLLKTDLDEILILTDSENLVTRYILDNFKESKKVKLFNGNYLDSFYLYTKANYMIMSYSTFSFAAGYFNSSAVCYFVKTCEIINANPSLLLDNAISPNWIIIDNPDYILNLNQDLVKKMISFYSKCYKHKFKKQKGGKLLQNKSIFNFVTAGPISIFQTKIINNLEINGVLDFDSIEVGSGAKIYGSVYGKNGYFNKLYVYGSVHMTNSMADYLYCYGQADVLKIYVKTAMLVMDNMYAVESRFNYVELLSTKCMFINCQVKTLVVNNAENNHKTIRLKYFTTINQVIVYGNPLTIYVDYGSRIGTIINGMIVVQ